MEKFFPFSLWLLLIICSDASAQFQFISPMPGSKNLNPGHKIIIRDGHLISPYSISENQFKIIGSNSGNHPFALVLADDGKTIVLTPDTPFDFGEVVRVNIIEGLTRANGTSVGSYSFGFSIREEYTEEQAVRLNDAKAYFRNTLRAGNDAESWGLEDVRDITGMFTITNNTNPSPGNIFFTSFSGYYNPTNYRGYHMISNTGDSLYSRETDTIYNNFCLTEKGYFAVNNGDFLRWDVLDSNFNVIDKYYPVNGFEVDDHEFLLLPDGRAFMIANEFQLVDMTVYNPNYSANAIVRGSVIQEFDASHNLIFEWRSFDHIEITEALHENLSFGTIDAVHMNALEVDDDGNLLTSSRHLDQINKIDLNTGEFIWRLGGVMNEFTWINEPEPFTYQHDIRRIANGNITIFDNGNYHPVKHTAVKEYQLDEVNLTASLVWSYRRPNGPGFYYYHAMGNAQRLSNGNTFIDWGWRPNNSPEQPSMTEVTSAGSIVWEMKMEVPDNIVSYRGYKHVFDACSRVTLNTMKTKVITSNSVKLVWNNAWNAILYKLQYKKTSGGPWITMLIDAPVTQATVHGLSPGTQYKWRIQSWCDSTGTKTSGYTSQRTFKTKPLRQTESNSESGTLRLYPNPARDVITVSCAEGISLVQVMDFLGQEVYRVQLKEENLIYSVEVPLSHLTAGNYCVKVTTSEKEMVKKIIIQ